MLAYSFAIWLGAVIPAPGGAGTVDAGLVAGLLVFQVDLPHAVAAVLIFRLVSFWLPLILGFGPLFWAYRRGYL
jgi:undecaprenyl-diphosphatase